MIVIWSLFWLVSNYFTRQFALFMSFLMRNFVLWEKGSYLFKSTWFIMARFDVFVLSIWKDCSMKWNVGNCMCYDLVQYNIISTFQLTTICAKYKILCLTLHKLNVQMFSHYFLVTYIEQRTLYTFWSNKWIYYKIIQLYFRLVVGLL